MFQVSSYTVLLPPAYKHIVPNCAIVLHFKNYKQNRYSIWIELLSNMVRFGIDIGEDPSITHIFICNSLTKNLTKYMHKKIFSFKLYINFCVYTEYISSDHFVNFKCVTVRPKLLMVRSFGIWDILKRFRTF